MYKMLESVKIGSLVRFSVQGPEIFNPVFVTGLVVDILCNDGHRWSYYILFDDVIFQRTGSGSVYLAPTKGQISIPFT